MPLFQHQNFFTFHSVQQQSTVRKVLGVYVPRVRDSLTVASSNLSSWSSQLRNLIAPSAAQSDSTTLTARLYTLVEEYPAGSYTTLLATLIAFLFLVTKYLMTYYAPSYRSDFGERRPAAGRHSPYTSFLASQTSNLSDYVEYIGHDSAPYPNYEDDHYHRSSIARPHAHAIEAEDAPDVLLLRHKGTVHELLFIPYAISDGKLYIQDVRHFAAEKLSTKASRVKLAYKGVRLTNDNLSAKDYGLKQNSEITVVISEAGAGSGDSYSGSDDDSGSAVSTREHRHHHDHHRRPRGQSTARHRSDVFIPEPAVQSAHLHPSSAGVAPPRQSRPAERSSGDSLNAPEYYSRHDREKSRTRQPSPAPHHTQAPRSARDSPPAQTTSAPPAPTSTYLPTTSSTNPNAVKLTTLTTGFQNTWLPQCERFMASPPSDPTSRDKEYKRLSETVMAQVVLKADDIETGGDPDLRKIRKRLVDDANALLKRLDGFKKA